MSLVLVDMAKNISPITPAAMYERDAAKYIKLGVNELRNFVKTGLIAARKHPGRKIRIFLKADLDQYLESLEREKEVDDGTRT